MFSRRSLLDRAIALNYLNRLETGLYFISSEDTVLIKLLWRRQLRSETQWRDVLGVLKVQRERLDFEHLREWANRLSVSDELDQAFREADVSK